MIASCSLVTVKNPPLLIPDEPVWINIKAEELDSLSQETILKLYDLDRQHLTYEEQLRAVILSTHE